MKKTLLLSAAMLFAVFSFAQNQSPPLSNQNLWNDRPDVIIKGEELRNFPGGDLLEMFFGRFPGLTQIAGATTETMFVVDGFVWQSIESLNINNIEEIAYYRGGLNSKFGVQNYAVGGVLYITTKSSGYNQPLNVNLNTQTGRSSVKNQGKLLKSDLHSYNLALGQGLEKFSWRAAAGYNSNTRNQQDFDYTHQFQLNGDVKYTPFKWIELRLNGNYAPLKGTYDWDKDPLVTIDRELKGKIANWNGFFNLRVEPIKGLVNDSRIIKHNVATDVTFYRSTDVDRKTYSSGLFSMRDKNFSVLNNLSYSFGIDKNRVKIKAATVFQYNDRNSSTVNESKSTFIDFFSSDLNIRENNTMNATESELKIYTFTGDLSIDLYNILNLQGGLRRDNYKGGNKVFYSPYYSADLNLKELLLKDVAEINGVSFFGSYGQYFSGTQFGIPSVYNTNLKNNQLTDANFDIDKMSMRSFGVKTTFFNRLKVSVDWYKNNNYAYIPVVDAADSREFLPIENNGWRVWAEADVFKNTRLKWNLGANVFENKMNLGEASGLQTGMQHRILYANFALNMNINAYFNSPVLIETTDVNNIIHGSIQKLDFVNLNFMSFGYNFKNLIRIERLREFNLSFVSRNLFQHKRAFGNTYLSRTLGLTLNASF